MLIMRYQSLSLFFWLIAVLTCYSQVFGQNLNEDDSNSNGQFVPTNEWQTIQEGQGIPRGLHVRINLQTGLKEAKLLDNTALTDDDKPHSTEMKLKSELYEISNEVQQPQKDITEILADLRSSLMTIPESENSSKTEEENVVKLDPAELKLALKKIKNDGKETSEDIGNMFRSYEQMKKEMEELQHSIKTEYEIVKELMIEYTATQEYSTKVNIILDLEFYVHQYDNAQDFVKMGGFQNIVIPALNATEGDLRSAAGFLTGSACQSNPTVQTAAVETGILPHLIRLVAFDSSNEVRSRAIYAISSIVRNFPAAQQDFLQHGGIASFVKMFQNESSTSDKLQLKIISLLSDLLSEKSCIETQLMDQTNNNEAAVKKLEDRLRLYNHIRFENVLVEQGFCSILPGLLAQSSRSEQDHDALEKILQAMLQLSGSCQDHFVSVDPIISDLLERYSILSEGELKQNSLENDESRDEFYFKKLLNLCKELLNVNKHDEL